MHVCWVAPRDARPNADLLQDAGVPCFDWPARTARAIGHARRYAVARARTTPAAAAPSARSGPTPTDPVSVAELLADLGVDTAPSTLCRSADEAADVAAAATTFPAVVKLAEAAHRTELGGVRLDLADEAAVCAAATELLTQGPVLVQRQLSGVEIAVGGVRDPVFGPVVMVGLGGIWVEVLGDVAFAMAPLDRAEARSLLESLRGAALLTGARGGPSVDLDALADVVVAAGNLLSACPDVVELDLNPVLATADSAVAVDWKIGVAPRYGP